jgi:SAM-dependent methyltransferase
VDHPLGEGYDVVICLKCGFVYADTTVSQNAYEKFYAQFSKYEDTKTSSGTGEKAWDRKRLEETAQQITEFLNDPHARILDMGCANGGLLKALKNLGYDNLLGIDPSLSCVSNTRALGIDALPGSLFQAFEQNNFDCVILSHILEHVSDIHGALNWIKIKIKTATGGCIYVEVPDASRYAEFVFAPFQDFNTEHINHFSLSCLRNALHKNGFQSIQQGIKTLETSPNMPYPAAFIFARLSPLPINLDIKPDQDLRNKINAYINFSNDLLEKMRGHLDKALISNSQVLVWGTGQLTTKLLVDTSLKDAKITAFVDSNPINQGKMLHGISIISPEAVRNISVPILIASTLHQQSIVEQIQQMGLTNKLIYLREENE